MKQTIDGEYIVTTFANGTEIRELKQADAPPAAPAPAQDFMSKYAFRDRFTTAEKMAIDLASIDHPNATDAERQRAAFVRVHMADLNSAAKIDRLLQSTRDGVQTMEVYGLIAAGRAREILDRPILPHERADS